MLGLLTFSLAVALFASEQAFAALIFKERGICALLLA